MHCNWNIGDKIIYRTPTPINNNVNIPEIEDIKGKIGKSGEIVFINNSNPNVTLPESGTINGIISTASSFHQHSDEFINKSLSLLKPDGILVLREPLLIQQSNIPDLPIRSVEDAKNSLLFAGFTNISQVSEGTPATLQVGSTQLQISTFEFKATKPSWIGQSSKLSSQPLKLATTTTTSTWKLDQDDILDDDIPILKNSNNSNNIWKISTQDADDDGLINEDDLLQDEDLTKQTGSLKSDDCELGKNGVKKACKNCTCGRAEQEQVQQQQQQQQQKGGSDTGSMGVTKTVNSSCGSCYLGDAFRCGGCPYRGMPAFKPGEKVTITL